MTTRNFVGKLLCSTALFSSFVIYSNHVFAQDAVQLDTISVESALDTVSDATTKTDDKIINTLAGASVVTRDEIKKFQPDSAAGLLTAVPGISVQEDSDDPGSAINIRGLQDFGRVNVMIDGARQNFQRSGHNANGQFYFEPELIKKVDIVRGPVSTIYGSGAIGGVVNFETIDPFDFLREGETWAASVKGQYATNDEAFLVSTIGAMKFNDTFSVLGNFVWRDHENYEDGDGNEVANTDKELKSALIKGVFDFAPGNQLKLGYIHKDDDYVTGATGFQRETQTEDRTFSAKWLFNPKSNDFIDLTASAYFTNTDTEQERLDGSLQGNTRNFDIDTFGFDIFNSSILRFGAVTHTITYGGDYFKDEVETFDASPFGSGDEFTPSGERETYGFYIQDKLEYGDWLEIIGALRYDDYELIDSNGLKVKDDQLSPKVTVGVRPFQAVQFYVTYAEGFRAPAITETLQSGVHPVFPNFDILPNPSLKPETAENWEGGVNLAFDSVFKDGDKFRAKASIFRNDVQDFIEDVSYGGFFRQGPAPSGAPACSAFVPFCQIYTNLEEVRLEGFELEASYDNNDFFTHLAYTHVRGDDLNTKLPLASVYPDKLVTTLGFRFLEEKLVVGGRWTYVAAQDRVPDPTSTNIEDQPSDSYNLVDLFATYEVNENFTTGLTLNNIFDEQYRPYRHTEPEPGFNAKLSATVRFGG